MSETTDERWSAEDAIVGLQTRLAESQARANEAELLLAQYRVALDAGQKAELAAEKERAEAAEAALREIRSEECLPGEEWTSLAGRMLAHAIAALTAPPASEAQE